MRTIARLVRLIAPFRWWVALAVLLSFATIGANVGLMAMSAYLISKSALVTALADVSLAVTAVRVFAIGRAVLRYAERTVSHTTTFRILTHLRVWFYEAIEPLAPARLQSVRSGDLLTRIVGDIETLENFYVRVVVPPLAAALVTAVACAILGAFDVRLALILLCFLTLTGVILPLATRRLSRGPAAALITTRAELNATLVDEIQGLADLLAYGQAARFQKRTEALSAQLHRLQERQALLRGVSNSLAALFTSLAGLSVLGLGVTLVSGGQMDGVYLALLPLTAVASFEAVQPLSLALHYLEESHAAGRRLFELLDAAPAVQDVVGRSPQPADYSLEFQNVRFRYGPDEPWALDCVSFHVPAGGQLAVVGPSGAGKSTLTNLLLRFWEADAGQILLGGRTLSAYRADDVRALISVVDQRPHLFNTTIRDNLALARADASEAEMVAACEQAQIHSFIAGLPQGYDTLVGENGVLLSGGERQRLAIARAILKDAPILILDEATAHLDPVTELHLLTALRPFLEGRTTLFIAHDAVGLRAFEQVLVLENGRCHVRTRAAV